MSGGTLGVTREPVGTRASRLRVPRWSAPAWGAVGVTLLFVALSAWWLASDRAVPFGGGASHLYASLLYLEFVRAGDPLRAITYATYYPPAIRLFGVLVLGLFGKSADGPILAQNVVLVPLLALAPDRLRTDRRAERRRHGPHERRS